MAAETRTVVAFDLNYLLVEPASAYLWTLDIMAYICNHFIRHSTSLGVIFREAPGLRLARARTVGTATTTILAWSPTIICRLSEHREPKNGGFKETYETPLDPPPIILSSGRPFAKPCRDDIVPWTYFPPIYLYGMGDHRKSFE